ELALLRIAQEALHNALRHAAGARVYVCLEQEGGEVRLTVSDHGPGFDPQALPRTTRTMGLATMRERATAVRGRLTGESAPGAGTAGYLLKDVEPDDLAAAIRQVHGGQPSLDPEVAASLMRRVAEPPAPPSEQLTPRELDVLRLVVEGFANKEIAHRLGITEKTVKTHVSSVLQKLGVPDRTSAAVLALRRRLV